MQSTVLGQARRQQWLTARNPRIVLSSGKAAFSKALILPYEFPPSRIGKMNTVASQINKPLLELHVIYWFVHPSTVPPKALGFLRDNEGRAFIIGGLTGSHWGGHADTWWKQFQKVVWEGYIPVERAIAQNLVPSDWMPPSLEGQDARFVNIILAQHE